MSGFLNNAPDIDSVTPISKFAGNLPIGLSSALNDAREFLRFYDWVSTIESEFLGVGVDGILYAFLFKIVPSGAHVDEWIWVIVGDIPPTYITCEDAKNPSEAIDSYLGAMEEWVDAARNGKSVAHLIPVNIPATPESAEMLDKRLKFIDEKILLSELR
jgi:hypothetical protein